MVLGMGPNSAQRTASTETRDVRDWLAYRGGAVFTVMAAVIVAWGFATAVMG